MVRREIEEAKASEAAIAAGLAAGSRRKRNGTSIVYSLRLTPAEVTALERRAAAMGIRPAVLARNLVRNGLRRRPDEEDLARAIDKVDDAVRVLRELAG